MPLRSDVVVSVALFLLVVIATAWLTLRLSKASERRAKSRRFERAALAEREAAHLLARAGFTVRGRQVRRSWSVLADGERVRFDLIADYLVEQSGRLWVAEVKTGERALDLRHGPTRRQLLEYREAFAADGVLLVDAEGERVREIEFCAAEPHVEGSRRVSWFAAGLCLGALAVWCFRALAGAAW